MVVDIHYKGTEGRNYLVTKMKDYTPVLENTTSNFRDKFLWKNMVNKIEYHFHAKITLSADESWLWNVFQMEAISCSKR